MTEGTDLLIAGGAGHRIIKDMNLPPTRGSPGRVCTEKKDNRFYSEIGRKMGKTTIHPDDTLPLLKKRDEIS